MITVLLIVLGSGIIATLVAVSNIGDASNACPSPCGCPRVVRRTTRGTRVTTLRHHASCQHFDAS